MRLQDKVVVITGATGGVGAACAQRFADEGAKVVVTDLDARQVEQVAATIGGVGLAGDITQEATVAAVAEFARRHHGQIDVWFSNAGITGPRQPGELQSDALWDTTWHLHVMSHVYAARAVLPEMLERGEGYLLQTASLVALATETNKVTYSVTKHAALALSEWLAVTYRPRGIRVSCFCPGPMLTPMLLANDFPADHPVLQRALTPAVVADRLVHAIDEEQFLIVDSPAGPDALKAKATDYDQWITDMSARLAPPTLPDRSEAPP